MGKKGFTLLEIIIVLAITGILAGGLVTVGHQVIKKEREDKTIEHMKRLKVAVMGDPLDARHGIRTSFGYFGDMGTLPSILDNLYILGTQTPYSFSQSLNTGAGWNGPYINPETMEYLNNLKKDYFRQDLQYTSPASFTPYMDSTVGVDVKERIASSGRDKQAGTGDDLSVVFFNNELYSRVSGFIIDPAGNGVSGVPVAINYASNGTLTSSSTTTGTNGSYSLTNVPYGNHSLSITPKPYRASGTGQTRDDGTTVSFILVNNGNSTVPLTSLRADYTMNPTTYYENVYVGTNQAFSQTNPRVATSGYTANFTPSQSLLGANSLTPPESPEAVAVCVQSPVTNVPDISLDSLGRGYATEITLTGFNNSPTGTGTGINMTGTIFTITLSDGTVVTFTP